MNVVKTVYYCKADKKTGKPVVVTKPDGSSKNVKKWTLDLFDKEGKPVRIEVEFNNSEKKARRSGATTVLKVLK